MSAGGLFTYPLSDSGVAGYNPYTPTLVTGPDNSGPSGAAPPGLGTNWQDPTQAGDTGSQVAADSGGGGFDVNDLFGKLLDNAFAAYVVSQGKAVPQRIPTRTTAPLPSTVGGIQSSTLLWVALGAVFIVLLFMLAKKG